MSQVGRSNVDQSQVLFPPHANFLYGSPSMAQQLSSISCESCRVKKCKCDRLLPFCSQCTVSEADCRYPQSNKRGIPTGYLANLEKRLTETEAALVETLLLLHGHSNDSEILLSFAEIVAKLQKHHSDQNRSDKVTEWRQIRLHSGSDRQLWLSEKKKQLQSVTDAPQSHRLHESPISVEAFRDAELSLENQDTSAFEPAGAFVGVSNNLGYGNHSNSGATRSELEDSPLHDDQMGIAQSFGQPEISGVSTHSPLADARTQIHRRDTELRASRGGARRVSSVQWEKYF